MENIICFKAPEEDIKGRRLTISSQIKAQYDHLRGSSIEKLSVGDLELLLQLYDEVFFNNWFKDSFKGKLMLSLSKRMTRSAGMTIYPKINSKLKEEDLKLEIRIGVDFFFHYDRVKSSKAVCGLETESSLEALQLVFEHELCHVLEFILYKKSSCKAQRFKTIANNVFGHRGSYHGLPTYRQIAVQEQNVRIGDLVAFSWEGKAQQGIVSNINKRATVMVLDRMGAYADKKGNRYSKYYVSINLLERV